MKMKYSSIVLAAFGLAVGILACKKEGENDPFSSYDRKAMLGNLGNNLIIPAFQSFQTESGLLKTAAETFAASPNEVNLKAVQDRWRSAAAAWKRAELYKLGPVEDQFLGVAVEYVPTNPTGIDNAIAAGNALNSDYVESKGTNVKGLPALEYLLFDRTNGNAAILGKFTTGDLAAKRREYLKALSQNLNGKASTILTAWQSITLAKFINADGRDVSSSLGLLTNEVIILTENIKNNKLGAPLGKLGNGTAQPSLVEAGQSESSLSHIKTNLQALENTFLGRNEAGQDGQGFDDLLDALQAKNNGQLLSVVIKAKFADVNTKVNAISMPLQDAVVQQPQAVESAYVACKELIVLLKVDMTSNLGVLVTFSDNDGD
jgi:predicted lipoprotein